MQGTNRTAYPLFLKELGNLLRLIWPFNIQDFLEYSREAEEAAVKIKG